MNRIDFQLNRRVECLPYMWWSQQELLKKYRDWQVWHLPSNRYGSTRMDLVIPAKVGRLDKKELNAGQTIGVIDEKKTRLAPTGFIVRSINFFSLDMDTTAAAAAAGESRIENRESYGQPTAPCCRPCRALFLYFYYSDSFNSASTACRPPSSSLFY